MCHVYMCVGDMCSCASRCCVGMGPPSVVLKDVCGCAMIKGAGLVYISLSVGQTLFSETNLCEVKLKAYVAIRNTNQCLWTRPHAPCRQGQNVSPMQLLSAVVMYYHAVTFPRGCPHLRQKH
jgi:hypothetical protein